MYPHSMKNTFAIICMLALLAFVGCTGGGTKNKHVPRPSDTLYTEKAAMDTYATLPERALQIIDSAEMVGNLTAVRADLLRAVVYSRTSKDMKYDSAILISERLMRHDSVMANPDLQEEVLEVLLNACRLRKDNEQALHWATQLVDLYRKRGEETEALRNDAEIGTFLIRIGEQTEGLARIDSVIQQLNGKRHFNELDASIIALKRKAEICNEIGLYDEVISAAQHILDHLNDYEQHPSDFTMVLSANPPMKNVPTILTSTVVRHTHISLKPVLHSVKKKKQMNMSLSMSRRWLVKVSQDVS